eukprot:4547295-Lingulodinium_polyedra.AAC.1
MAAAAMAPVRCGTARLAAKRAKHATNNGPSNPNSGWRSEHFPQPNLHGPPRQMLQIGRAHL